MGISQSKPNDILSLELEVEESRHKFVLNWSNRSISSVPDSVRPHYPYSLLTNVQAGTLSHLVEMDLYSNQLTFIPDSFINLHSLIKLDLGHNMLSEFPLCICELHNLQSLYIQNNLISDVPVELGKLAGSLCTLNLSDNRLSDVPMCLGELKRLGEKNVDFSVPSFGVLLSGNHFPVKSQTWINYDKVCMLLESPIDLQNDYDNDEEADLHAVIMNPMNPEESSGVGMRFR